MRLLTALLFVSAVCLPNLSAERRSISILATTDLHGNIYPYDYLTGKPAERGLAKIATLIAEARKEHPNSLLIDCGDTTQGTVLESVHQISVRNGETRPDPMMLAMNALRYDVMVLGNHEFNFGLVNLAKTRSEARFPWISSNTKVMGQARVKPFASFIVNEVAGVKIAVIGVTTPALTQWESPENYQGYRLQSPVDGVRAALEEIRASEENPDVVIVASHSGLDRDLKTGLVGEHEAEENAAYQIATEVKGIDAIVFGHTHLELAGQKIGDVVLLQPKNWGGSLGELDLTLEREAGKRWRLVEKSSRVIPVVAGTAADAKILELARPYHEATEAYLNRRIGVAKTDLDGRLSRVQDSALVDAIENAELNAAKADVAFSPAYDVRLHIPAGPVTVRQIAALYPYDNQLYAIQGNGRMVREALENAARYFLSCPGDCAGKELINSSFAGYNFDMAQGVDYEIDVTEPEGQRIKNLRFHGEPLADDRKLRIAMSNYRAAAGAGYRTFRDAPVLWRSTDFLRDVIVQNYSNKPLPERADGNWKIVPESAAQQLKAEALR